MSDNLDLWDLTLSAGRCVQIPSLVVWGKKLTWIGVRIKEAQIDNVLCCSKLFSVAVYQFKKSSILWEPLRDYYNWLILMYKQVGVCVASYI